MREDSQFGTGASLDTLADNRAGRATALTTLTPLPRIWSPFVALVLRIKARLGPDRTLRRLSFIHMAYWVLIDRLPLEPRRGRYPYLLFVSNFNGSWFDYIDAFSEAVPQKMALLWGTSYGFPGARPPRPFTEYIRTNDKPLEHYYSAYPGATTTEIASALRVQEQVHLDPRLASAGIDDDSAELVPAWREFLDRAQRDL